jgi:hypothetical protein
MDAINALVSGLDAQQAVVNGAAQQIAAADLPTVANPDPTNPAHPDVRAAGGNVDVADQLTTLMVAADAHHLTTAALRAALSTYQDVLDIKRA